MGKWIITITLVLLGSSAPAATIKWVTGSSIGCTLKISGVIEYGDAERLETLVNAVRLDEGRFCFDSPGGSFEEAIRIAETMYMRPTGVDAGDRCESACFLAFMAGTFRRLEDRTPVSDRVMHPMSRVGFHAPSLVIPRGEYSQSKVTEAYGAALLSVANLIKFRVQSETYKFRDLLLDEMLRIPPGRIRYVETVGDASLFDIVIYPIALPSAFSVTHAAQACRALGRMSEHFNVTEEFDTPVVLSRTDGAVAFSAYFNRGESASQCIMNYRPDSLGPDATGGIAFAPIWSLGQAHVDDWYIDSNDFEIAAYMHFPFKTEIRDLPLDPNPSSTNAARIRGLSQDE